MEQDNFEEQLRAIVVQADQKIVGASHRERIWTNVEIQTNRKKRWYYAAAAILIIGFSIGIPFNDETNSISIKQHPITISKKTQAPSIVKVAAPTEKARKIGHLKVAEAPQRLIDRVFEEEHLPKQPTNEPVTSVVFAQALPIEKEIQVNSPTIAQPIKEEFTVQFKRGSTALVKEEPPVYTAFRKFRLKRDTNIYIANTVEKQVSIIKLSFKKEN
ncbi:MAG TPA: hypothetical protein VL088_14535 [Pedobacter sp.]|nr:hypothetical protein [Pedobacter sp.]